MYEEHSELSDFVKNLKTPKNDVLVLQIMAGNEMDFDYKRSVTFEDLETGTKIKVDVNKAKMAYLKALETQIGQIKEKLLSQGISHYVFRMDEPLGDALQLFLKERTRLN
jgi:L-lactate utilization protein LutB